MGAILLLFVSMILYSISYIAFAKLRSERKSVNDAIIFAGLQGVVILLTGWIPIIVLHYSGLEVFELWKPSLTTNVMLNTFIKPALTYSTWLSIAMTNPLFFNIGLILLTPVGIVVESITEKMVLGVWFYVGLAFIL